MARLQGFGDQPNIPGASPQFQQFISSVRMFIRDFPELNRLVSGEESSDRMIAWAAIDAISDFNGTPPDLGVFTFSDLMAKSLHSFLRKGTTINLLYSVGILQTRNHLPFSDGGLNVAVSDKTPLIQSWIQLLERTYEVQKQQIKIAWNMESLLGGSVGAHSEYFALSGYYLDLTV
jgi:hypothetical protein